MNKHNNLFSTFQEWKRIQIELGRNAKAVTNLREFKQVDHGTTDSVLGNYIYAYIRIWDETLTLRPTLISPK